MKQFIPAIWLLLCACETPVGTKADGDTGATADVVTFGGVRFQPGAVNFGTVTPDMSATATIGLINASNSDVKVSNAFTNGDGFRLEGEVDFPITLEPDDKVDVAVNFNPQDEGDYEGTLNVGVAGEVGYGEVNLKGAARSSSDGDSDGGSSSGELQVFPDALAFGEAGLTDTVWRSIELSNVGSSEFLVKSISSSNPAIFQAEPDFGLPKLMDPGSTAFLQIGFNPSEMRDYTGIIDIETDTDSGGLLVPLSGTGSESGCTVCAPIMNVSTSSGGSEALVLSPPSGLGCTANGSVTISNTGDMDLDVTNASIVNDFISTCGTFVLSWAGTTTVTPGTSMVLGVDYVATEACLDLPYSDFGHNVLTIQGTDPSNPIHDVTLEGNALFCG